MWAWVMGSPETHWLSLEYSSWGARLWQFGEDQKKQTTCLLLKIGRMVLAWCWLWLVLPHHGETQAQGDLWNWHGAKKGRRLPFDAPRRPTTARSTSAAARQDDSNQMRLAQNQGKNCIFGSSTIQFLGGFRLVIMQWQQPRRHTLLWATQPCWKSEVFPRASVKMVS